jgi:hypothetical protein
MSVALLHPAYLERFLRAGVGLGLPVEYTRASGERVRGRVGVGRWVLVVVAEDGSRHVMAEPERTRVLGVAAPPAAPPAPRPSDDERTKAEVMHHIRTNRAEVEELLAVMVQAIDASQRARSGPKKHRRKNHNRR